MVDLSLYIKALQCTQSRRLLNSNNPGWISLFYKMSGNQNVLFIDGGHPSITPLFQQARYPNRFWIEVFKAYHSLPYCFPSEESTGLFFFRYNHNIAIGKNVYSIDTGLKGS